MNITGEMKWHLGEGDYANLKFSESKTSMSVDIVMVPVAHRKKGIGAMLIKRVLILADLMGKDCYVSARPLGNYSDEKLEGLVRYYERMGFKIIDRGLTTAYMVRKAVELFDTGQCIQR